MQGLVTKDGWPAETATVEVLQLAQHLEVLPETSVQ